MANTNETDLRNVGEIFQISSPDVRNYYENFTNIKVIDEPSAETDLCVIYFSSNELYYPNTKSAFDYSVVSRDKYEWLNTKFIGASRHIFVRDVQKQWYIEGVNVNQNSPQLLYEKLKSLCAGKRVFTMGSSAGGFAAILFGSLLLAERVYAFNAQLNLNLIVNSSNEQTDPLLFKYYRNSERAKYFLIDNFLTKETRYYYFQSAHSSFDQEQYKGCVNKQFLIKIEFNTSNHGFPFLRHDLKFILSMSENELQRLSSKTWHPVHFSIHNHGFFYGIYLVMDSIVKRIKKLRQVRLNK